MLFINHSASSNAAKEYFKQELAQADYYMKDGQQISGQWHGLGAKALGLDGPKLPSLPALFYRVIAQIHGDRMDVQLWVRYPVIKRARCAMHKLAPHQVAALAVVRHSAFAHSHRHRLFHFRHRFAHGVLKRRADSLIAT